MTIEFLHTMSRATKPYAKAWYMSLQRNPKKRKLVTEVAPHPCPVSQLSVNPDALPMTQILATWPSPTTKEQSQSEQSTGMPSTRDNQVPLTTFRKLCSPNWRELNGSKLWSILHVASGLQLDLMTTTFTCLTQRTTMKRNSSNSQDTALSSPLSIGP